MFRSKLGHQNRFGIRYIGFPYHYLFLILQAAYNQALEACNRNSFGPPDARCICLGARSTSKTDDFREFRIVVTIYSSNCLRGKPLPGRNTC